MTQGRGLYPTKQGANPSGPSCASGALPPNDGDHASTPLQTKVPEHWSDLIDRVALF